jgi:hypothetical protein
MIVAESGPRRGEECRASFRYIGQPPVIGEIVAGIMLGSALLGSVSPEAFGLISSWTIVTTTATTPLLGLLVPEVGVRRASISPQPSS